MNYTCVYIAMCPKSKGRISVFGKIELLVASTGIPCCHSDVSRWHVCVRLIIFDRVHEN